MNLEKIINNIVIQHDPIAIFQYGSRALGINDNNSDYDLMVISNNPRKRYFYYDAETGEKIDIFFTNKEFQTDLNILRGLAHLQFLFITKNSLLYQTPEFDYGEFISSIKEKQNKLLFELIKSDITRFKFYSYNQRSKKAYYHYAYVASLVSNEKPNWEIIKRIKSWTENKSDIKYLEKCRKLLFEWYLKEKEHKEEENE